MLWAMCVVGAVMAIALGVPAVVWLTKLIHPPKPEEEAIHRGVEDARRRNDRLLY